MSEPLRPLPNFPHTFTDYSVVETDCNRSQTVRDPTPVETDLLNALNRVVGHLELLIRLAPEAERNAVQLFREHQTEEDLCFTALDFSYVRKWLGGTEFKVETIPAFVRDRVMGWKIWVGETGETSRAKVRVVRPKDGGA